MACFEITEVATTNGGRTTPILLDLSIEHEEQGKTNAEDDKRYVTVIRAVLRYKASGIMGFKIVDAQTFTVIPPTQNPESVVSTTKIVFKMNNDAEPVPLELPTAEWSSWALMGQNVTAIEGDGSGMYEITDQWVAKSLVPQAFPTQ